MTTVEPNFKFFISVALADFQYIVPKDDKIRRLKEALKIGDGKIQTRVFLLKAYDSSILVAFVVDTIMNYKVPNDDEDFNNLRNIPPPAFTAIEAPFSYGYKQNASVLRVRVRQPDGSVSNGGDGSGGGQTPYTLLFAY